MFYVNATFDTATSPDPNTTLLSPPKGMEHTTDVPFYMIQRHAMDILGFWTNGMPAFDSFVHPLTLLGSVKMNNDMEQAPAKVCITNEVLYIFESLPIVLDYIKAYDESGAMTQLHNVNDWYIFIHRDGDTVYICTQHTY